MKLATIIILLFAIISLPSYSKNSKETDLLNKLGEKKTESKIIKLDKIPKLDKLNKQPINNRSHAISASGLRRVGIKVADWVTGKAAKAKTAQGVKLIETGVQKQENGKALLYQGRSIAKSPAANTYGTASRDLHRQSQRLQKKGITEIQTGYQMQYDGESLVKEGASSLKMRNRTFEIGGGGVAAASTGKAIGNAMSAQAKDNQTSTPAK